MRDGFSEVKQQNMAITEALIAGIINFDRSRVEGG
jgi:hypothetical protein